MKYVCINFEEKYCPYSDAIRDSFIVEYESKEIFEAKMEKLHTFEAVVEDLSNEYEDQEIVEDTGATQEDIALAKKYYEESTISAISNYVCDLFNLLHIEETIEETW